MKEQTSVRLLGIHFRYMKACTQHCSLSNFEATICHIPYSTGYLPKEWKKSINTIIEKKGKGCIVSDLCTINLMEVDFNFNNKIIAWDILQCTKINELLLIE
jgi:hypothetical protein